MPPVRTMSIAHTTRMIDGSASRRSATPPATPASIRSSTERYKRSSIAATLRIQREGRGRAVGPEIDPDVRVVIPGRRPHGPVLDEVMEVIARSNAAAGLDPESRAGRNARPGGAGGHIARAAPVPARKGDPRGARIQLESQLLDGGDGPEVHGGRPSVQAD